MKGGVEGSCHEWWKCQGERGRSQVREVSADHELTPFLLLSCFSSQPDLTPPRAGCRRSRMGQGCPLLPIKHRGLPCRRKDASQGSRSKGAVSA